MSCPSERFLKTGFEEICAATEWWSIFRERFPKKKGQWWGAPVPHCGMGSLHCRAIAWSRWCLQVYGSCRVYPVDTITWSKNTQALINCTLIPSSPLLPPASIPFFSGTRDSVEIPNPHRPSATKPGKNTGKTPRKTEYPREVGCRLLPFWGKEIGKGKPGDK